MKFDDSTIVYMIGNGMITYMLSKTHWLFFMLYAMFIGFALNQIYKKR